MSFFKLNTKKANTFYYLFIDKHVYNKINLEVPEKVNC